MRTVFIFICTVLLLAGCENSTTDPIFSQLNGQWKLVKIGIGFPMPDGPTELKPDYEEILEFNSQKGNFTRSKDGKVIEKSNVSFMVDNNASQLRGDLIFEDSKTYSPMSFTETPKYLVLYQSAPIGATLADGNSFFYEKIK